MKQGWKKYLLYSTVILVFGSLAFFLVRLGYSYSWTGFGKYVLKDPNTVPSKTLWDWMELLIVPLVLAGGAFYLNRSERAVERQSVEARTKEDRKLAEDRATEDRKLAEDRAKLERDLATDHQHEMALQTYFDRMSELLLKEKLRTTENVVVLDVARTRTISTMRGLDTERNRLILQFLNEAKLIADERSILSRANMSNMKLQYANLDGAYLEGTVLAGANLDNADLQNANLQGTLLLIANLHNANLHGANLQGANLDSANLRRANLVEANLQDAYLQDAKLQGAYLQDANMKDANLEGANLEDAYLERADLEGANLEGANMKGANLQYANLEGTNMKDVNLQYANLDGVDTITDEQLVSVKSLKGATMPDGTEHE